MTYTPGSAAAVIATDFATLQEAIDATPAGGTLLLPVGDYPVSGTGSHILLISKPIVVRGEGAGSRIVVAPTVPETTDIIRVFSNSGEIVGLQLRDFAVVPASGRPGRFGVHLDAQLGFNVISNAALSQLQIGLFGAAGLAMSGPTPPNFDGIFTTTVSDNVIQGGLLLDRAGDSLRFFGNNFSGPGEILVRLIGQGSNTPHGFAFMFNNVTANGGIRVENAWGGAISYNNIELYDGATGSNGAVIDLEGNGTIPPEDFEVRSNYVGGGPSVPINIRVNRMKFCRIEGNMLPRGSGKTIVVTANADRTQIVRNREQPYGELIQTWLQDDGSNTMVEYIHPNTGRLTFTGPVDLAGAVTVGSGVSITNSNTIVQYLGEIVTTAAASDTVLDSRYRVGSHCMAVPLNPIAAGMTGVYAAAGDGVVTLFHPPVAGGGFAIFASII